MHSRPDGLPAASAGAYENLGAGKVRIQDGKVQERNLMVRHHALTPWRVALQCRTGWLEGRESQDHMKFLTFMKRKKLENREKF